jgi:hypothetical protein
MRQRQGHALPVFVFRVNYVISFLYICEKIVGYEEFAHRNTVV